MWHCDIKEVFTGVFRLDTIQSGLEGDKQFEISAGPVLPLDELGNCLEHLAKWGQKRAKTRL